MLYTLEILLQPNQLNTIYQTMIFLGLFQDTQKSLLILDYEFRQLQEHQNITLELTSQHLNGAKLYAVSAGTITYLGFNGANGYTIMLKSNNMIFAYGHVSPDFVVKIGDFIRE